MDSSDTDDAAEEEDGKGGGERGVYEVVSAAPARRSRQRSPSNSGNSDFAVLSLQGGSEGGDGDEIPKWLKDADRQDRLRRRKGPRKPKPLLKDWRFWAAGILVVGCVAAFVNMYQMTGGFGTMDSAIADKFNGFSD